MGYTGRPMRPILDPQRLQPGTTLYHSAFGFASVADVGAHDVRLDWERAGAHLPHKVAFDNLQRVYTVCGEQGFFHRALKHPDAMRQVLHDRPADAMAWLLEDLGSPQRMRDVMDWLVGRDLFTAKTFVRWWGTAEGLVRADGRMTLEGDWLHLRGSDEEDDDPGLVQLAPATVATVAEVDPASSIYDTEDDGDDATATLVTAYAPVGAVPLGTSNPPATSLPEVGRAVADALARAHGEGQLVHPQADATILQPDGSVTFDPTDPSDASWAEPPSPAADVRQAAAVLMEAFLGRAIPNGADPAELLPHLRHRLPDLPPSALAPLVAALQPEPDQRPTASEWADHWQRICHVAANRPDDLDLRAPLHAGYDSHVGKVKLLVTQTNQDRLWVGARGLHSLFVLADGISVSDAGSGELASWLAVQSVARLWQAVPLDRVSPRKLLDRAHQLGNRAICERALRAAGGDLTGRMPMGTTIVTAVAQGNRVHVAWLGDSRAYLVGPWGVSQLTADDNVSGERFSAWCQGRTGSWRSDGHALVRYLGHFDALATTPAPFAAHHTALVLRPDERLVICSDGITDYLGHHEAAVARRLGDLAREGEVDAAARRLVDAANSEGGGDNASVLVIAHDDAGLELW